MVTTLDDTKRTAIASKLADMTEVQSLIIRNEEQLLSACKDDDIRERLQKMLEDDRKNQGILETVVVQYGVKGEPKSTVKDMKNQLERLMQGSDLSLYEKFAQHELLKHGQTMSGLLVHKAAQIAGADVEAAITPLNTLNFENRAHQEQLKGIMEKVGVYELTGEKADQGLWGRVQDAIAAISGVAGSAITHTDDEIDIRNLIRMDHQKASLLFNQIAGTDSPQKAQEYFGQLYKDLTVHAEAEEEVVYPAVRPFYGDSDTQELYDEQAQMKATLKAIKALNPGSAEFKQQVKQLQDVVMDHVRQEESTMFTAIRNNCSDEQQKQMATQFKSAKAKLQDQLAAAMK